MVEFDPRNPYRVVSWRWERAGDIAGGGPALSRRRDDRWIKRACSFRRALKTVHNRFDQQALLDRDPAVFYAHQFYTNKDNEARRQAPHMIEARLLARQSCAEIAPKVAATTEIVEAYAQLYFDVADRLEAEDYIHQMVFGPSVARGIRLREFDLIWKIVAYAGGPYMLEYYARGAPVRRAGTHDEAETVAWQNYKSELTKLSNLSARTARPNDNLSCQMFMQLAQDLVKAERDGGAGGDTQNQITQNIKVALEGIQFSVGTRAEGASLAMQPYDALGVELRSDEAMQLAFNRPAPPPAVLQLIGYPEKQGAAQPEALAAP